MKRTFIGILLLALVTTLLIGCNSQEGNNQPLPVVEQGDLIVSVSGSGNIVVSIKAKLAFSSGGRIVGIYVDEGDEVIRGQSLARLDTGPLKLALAQTLAARDQTKVARDQAKLNLEQVEEPYSKRDIERAEVTVEWAEDKLDYAEFQLNHAEWWLSRVEEELHNATPNELADTIAAVEKRQLGVGVWKDRHVPLALANLHTAETRLENMLDAPEKFKVERAEWQLEIIKSQLKADKLAVVEAQKQLDEATIIAPFDGMITDIYVEEGHTISIATPIINLIDLTSMELAVDVDEIDIVGVKVGQKALIEIDALSALQLEGEVKSISTMPKFEAGLVLYVVKIGFDIPSDSGLKVDMSAIADIIIE